MELNSTLHKYLDDQNVQENWNDLQKNVTIIYYSPSFLPVMQMECCGVSNFTDYQLVFSNLSVPVSCCNTTNPLASECRDIVRNSQQMINQTGLIYSEVSTDIADMHVCVLIIFCNTGMCFSFGVFQFF